MIEEFQYAYQILDANPKAGDLGSCALGDLDGDGLDEIVIGGDGFLAWYDYPDPQPHVIARGHFGVELALYDVDGDGQIEVIVACVSDGEQSVASYEAPEGPRGAWALCLSARPFGRPQDKRAQAMLSTRSGLSSGQGRPEESWRGFS